MCANVDHDGWDLRETGPVGADHTDSISVENGPRGGVVFGGPRSDQLFGPYAADGETQVPIEIHGGDGSDHIDAAGTLYGGRGDDFFEGPTAPSRIFGGAGDEEITGSSAADFIDAGPGRDTVWADYGNDVIRTLDGQTDRVFCDDGRDRLTADGRDDSELVTQSGPFRDCEVLVRRGQPLVSLHWFEVWEQERYVSFTYGCPPGGPRRCVGDASLSRRGRLIARRDISERAGNSGGVDFTLGVRRIRALVDTDVRVTIRWRDRAGRMRRRSTVTQISEPDYDSSRR